MAFYHHSRAVGAVHPSRRRCGPHAKGHGAAVARALTEAATTTTPAELGPPAPPAARASTPVELGPPAPNRPRCVPSGGHRLGERARRARTRGRAEPPSVRVTTSMPRARAGPRLVACRAEPRRLRCSTSRAARAEAPPVARREQQPVLLFSLPLGSLSVSDGSTGEREVRESEENFRVWFVFI